jgi:hypothetical protein
MCLDRYFFFLLPLIATHAIESVVVLLNPEAVRDLMTAYVSLSPKGSADLSEQEYPEFRRQKVRMLRAREKTEKRSAANRLNRRRFARDQMRQHIKAYKAKHGGQTPPVQDIEPLPENARFLSQESRRYIVIPPRPDMSHSSQGDTGETRELGLPTGRKENHARLKEILNEVLPKEQANSMVAPKNLQKNLHRRQKSTKAGSRKSFAEPLIGLRKIGACILVDPGRETLNSLKERGARVFEDRLVTLVDTVPAGTENSPAPSTASRGTADAWHLKALGAETARKKKYDGANQWLGIIDTGCDLLHPEFAGKEKRSCFIENAALDPSRPPGDRHGHGTAVASLAVGKSLGVAPAANLAVAALASVTGSGTTQVFASDILTALDWMLDLEGRGCRVIVINASIGDPDFRAMFSELGQQVMTYWNDGQFFICAAVGNDGPGTSRSPANFRHVLAVGACDEDDRLCSFSGSAHFPDPADGDPAAYSKPDLVSFGDEVLAAKPGGSYGPHTGTSFAAPLVSGACLSLISKDAGLSENFPELLDTLRSLCRQPASGHADGYGAGILDLSRI